MGKLGWFMSGINRNIPTTSRWASRDVGLCPRASYPGQCWFLALPNPVESPVPVLPTCAQHALKAPIHNQALLYDRQTLKAPIHFMTQSHDQISCCRKPVEWTDEIGPTSNDFIAPLHWFPVATDRIARLSQKGARLWCHHRASCCVWWEFCVCCSHQTRGTVRRWSQSLSVPLATVCFVPLS